ncbi:hypothetical protein H0Z60_21410, partial [Ectothiorhodospiraceae bacterium WFHF3C12]|nr:hypothetical protein [Ectothiorhodospiraceae bacterium WFHF3C12]
RPVDRIALEASGAVSETFIDRVAEVAAEVDGEGEALIAALREGRVSRFQSSKTDELDQWLREQGYIDSSQPLPAEERERRTLMEAAGSASAAEIREQVAWLETGLAGNSRSG